VVAEGVVLGQAGATDVAGLVANARANSALLQDLTA
jgi:hypothetical protein